MSRFLAIDADAHGLFVAAASLRGGGVALERVLAWADESPPLSPGTAADLGRRLKDLLKQAGVKPAPVLLCVGRDRVILKDVRHPAAPPAQEPNVVRFQAQRDLTESPDDVVMDYTPAGGAPDGDRKALAVFARKDVLTAARLFCEAAGLKLAALTPRPFALAAVVRYAVKAGSVPAPADPADAVAVVSLWDRGGEFAVVRGPDVLFARSVSQAALAGDHALAADLKRNLAVFAGQQPNAPVAAVYVAGPGDNGLADRVRSALPVPVHGFDPAAGAPNADLVPAPLRGRFAGPVGLLALRAASSTLPVNFAHPRQPKAEPGKARVRVLLGVLAAVLVFGMLGVLAYLEVDKAGRKVADLQLTKTGLDQRLQAEDLNTKRLAAADEFTAREVVVLDQMYDFTDRVPDVKLVSVTEYDLTATNAPKAQPRATTGGPPQPAAPVKPGPVAVLKVTYKTADGQLAQNVVDTFKNDAYFIGAGKIKAGQGDAQNKDQQSYVLTASALHRAPDKYTRRLRVAPPAAPAVPAEAEVLDVGFGGGFAP